MFFLESMRHSKSPPMLIPLIVSVSEGFMCICFPWAFISPVVQVLGRLWKQAARRLGLDPSSRLHPAESLQQSKHYAPTTNKTRKWQRHRGHFSDHKFVLGGWTAFGGCVCVRLVPNSHLHGKPQALLVNSPVDRKMIRQEDAQNVIARSVSGHA